nr:MAG TPA: hypothetical protein [Caudoviricetes sp.]
MEVSMEKHLSIQEMLVRVERPWYTHEPIV